MIMVHHTIPALLLALVLLPPAARAEPRDNHLKPHHAIAVDHDGVVFQAHDESGTVYPVMRFSFSDLDPGFSRDSKTPDDAFRALAASASNLRIPAHAWVLQRWDEAPLLRFRREFPPAANEADTSLLFWVGNVPGTYEGLRIAIAAALDLADAGLPFWGQDIGGLVVGNPEVRINAELFVRWTEFAALSPVMRLHGRYLPCDPWLYEEPLVAQTFRDYSWLHRNLRPYLLSELVRAARERQSIVAPINGAGGARCTDAYHLGASLLVEPVAERRRIARRVTLPAGTWWNFWTEERRAGPAVLDHFPAPVEIIPLFVRAGSAIPMELDRTYAPMAAITDSPRWTLRLYPDRGRVDDLVYAPAPVRVRMTTDARGRRRVVVDGADRAMSIIVPEIEHAPARVVANGATLKRCPDWDALASSSSGWYVDEQLARIVIRVEKNSRVTIAF